MQCDFLTFFIFVCAKPFPYFCFFLYCCKPILLSVFLYNSTHFKKIMIEMQWYISTLFPLEKKLMSTIFIPNNSTYNRKLFWKSNSRMNQHLIWKCNKISINNILYNIYTWQITNFQKTRESFTHILQNDDLIGLCTTEI